MPDGSQRSQRAPTWWRRILRDPQRTRLDEAIRISTLRLHHLRAGLDGEETAAHRIADQIESALTAAEGDLARQDIDTGYAHVHLAWELEFGLLGDVELHARTIELRAEAEAGKYGQRRGRTILKVLDEITPDPNKLDRDGRAIVSQAARIAMTASSNEYRKLTILRRNQTILLLMATVALLAAAIITMINAQSFNEIDHWWVAAVSVLLGALGALTSALQRSTGQADDTIPMKLTSYVVALSRPLLGATAGLIAYVGQRVVLDSDGAASVGAVLLAAFAAGFTERLLPVNSSGTAPAESKPADLTT